MSYTSKYFFFLAFTFLAYTGIAQDIISKAQGDSLYRDDQFYLGFTYNLLTSIPSGVHPEGLSGGFYFGFLRDMPINKKRNIAIAIGAGISYDQYSSNLLIDKDSNGDTTFTILESDVDFNSNRFKTALVEIPLELRWRSSTPTTYKFWRAYAGLKVGYAFWNKTSFKSDTGTISHSDISEFENLSLGATLSLGYNKFNFFLYYSINPFFKDEAITNDAQQVNFKTIKLGLIFYIL